MGAGDGCVHSLVGNPQLAGRTHEADHISLMELALDFERATWCHVPETGVAPSDPTKMPDAQHPIAENARAVS